MLKAGAENCKSMYKELTPLYVAACNGYFQVVRLLIASTDIENLRQDLPVAAKEGNVHLVEMLLLAGVDKESTTDEGQTALLLAARKGPTRLVELLLRQGVDTEKADNNGLRPLSMAAYFNEIEIVKLLLGAGADPNGGYVEAPLMGACHRGNLEIVSLLLAAGADIDRPLKNGLTPLYEAARSGKADIVRLLLDVGAQKNFPHKKDGSTPLNVAVHRGHIEVVKLLLDYDVDFEQRTYDGKTPLLMATCPWSHCHRKDALN